MFDRLCGAEKTSVQSGRSFVLFDNLCTFVRDADDSCTGLALRFLLDNSKHLLKALDLAFGLGVVLLKCGLELLALRSLCHFRQCREDLLLREVDLLSVS